MTRTVEQCGCVVTKHGGHTHTQLCTACRTVMFNRVAREDSARREARAKVPETDFSDLI